MTRTLPFFVNNTFGSEFLISEGWGNDKRNGFFRATCVRPTSTRINIAFLMRRYISPTFDARRGITRFATATVLAFAAKFINNRRTHAHVFIYSRKRAGTHDAPPLRERERDGF